VTVLFYRRDGGNPFRTAAELPSGYALRIWRPGENRLPPLRSALHLAWWAQDKLGCFATHGFAEISIWRDERLLHRLIVTPRWYRFPFMDAADLQIGAVWTRPEARGQGLARTAIGEAHRLFGEGTPWFWYVVDDGNRASVALIESCGYRLVGKGLRTRPLGIAPLGRFCLESASS
jgi:RimJ/RimL family protein N-acetyltransferase